MLNRVKPSLLHQVVNHEQRLGVGHVRVGADRVEIALDELAVASLLRLLGPPHGRDVIPLEGRADLLQVLRGEAGQGHGQVEPHGDVAFPLVGEAEELLVGLFAPFSQQDFGVFERGRVDR